MAAIRPALARSTAPTFHDFRTFPELRQLQGRKENEEKPQVKQVANQASELQGLFTMKASAGLLLLRLRRSPFREEDTEAQRREPQTAAGAAFSRIHPLLHTAFLSHQCRKNEEISQEREESRAHWTNPSLMGVRLPLEHAPG